MLVNAKDLCKEFRSESGESIRALVDVSLMVQPGEVLVVRGESGSGKTTLLSLLGLLDWPTSGSLAFAGQETTALSGYERTRLRRRIGLVFQDSFLLPRLPIWENMTIPLVALGVPRLERRRRAGDLLARLNLQSVLHAMPERLSGGERQRIAALRALVTDPDLILADEPTSNLDPTGAAEMLQILTHPIEAMRKRTVIMASHDPAVAPGSAIFLDLRRQR